MTVIRRYQNCTTRTRVIEGATRVPHPSNAMECVGPCSQPGAVGRARRSERHDLLSVGLGHRARFAERSGGKSLDRSGVTT